MIYLLLGVRPLRLCALGKPKGLKRDECIYLRDYDALMNLEVQIQQLNEPVLLFIGDITQSVTADIEL